MPPRKKSNRQLQTEKGSRDLTKRAQDRKNAQTFSRPTAFTPEQNTEKFGDVRGKKITKPQDLEEIRQLVAQADRDEEIRSELSRERRKEQLRQQGLATPELASLQEQQIEENKKLREGLTGENANIENILPNEEQPADLQEELKRSGIDVADVGAQDRLLSNALAGATGTLGAASIIGGGIAAAPVAATSGAGIAASTAKLAGWSKILIGGGVLSGLGFSGSKVISSLTAGRQAELEGDISELTGHSRNVVVDVKNGGDVDEAIALLRSMEGDQMQMLSSLHLAIQNDPFAKLRQKNIEQFALNNVGTIQKRRQLIERYQFTHDLNSLNAELGQFGF